MWTQFVDMYSGGSTKHEYNFIYIESPEEEAKVIFYNRFGSNPERVTCTCCGDDYSISESETLEQATGYERGCHSGYIDENGGEAPQDSAWIYGKGLQKGYKHQYFERAGDRTWHKYIPLDEYIKKDGVLVIRAGDIKGEEREGDVPEQGYVWQD